ncbi:hypothetical protein MHY01S_26020 [Meiothermus hypogaeus NBRC 106114]|uniref:Uncharacterized protein n=1 Tax=Meiothermus hypogaeus NBRC 106114 TaxID=1227553 RepID=A0A511R5Y3_9DEIN|nr:hypothetical protein MHY01S_26020 [Meiothermus hypogaeus NBRC 106114]
MILWHGKAGHHRHPWYIPPPRAGLVREVGNTVVDDPHLPGRGNTIAQRKVVVIAGYTDDLAAKPCNQALGEHGYSFALP